MEIKTIFNGKKYTIGALEKERGLAIKIVNPSIEKSRYFGAQKIADEVVIIEHVSRYDKTYLAVKYYSPTTKKSNYFYCDETFEVQKVSKTCIKSILADYEVHMFQHVTLFKPGTVGSDPEIFVEGADGEVIPAFEFLGSKKEPNKALPSHKHASIELGMNDLYWDGFQAEFTTTPNQCLAWQVDSVQLGLQGVLTHARKINPAAKLSLKTVMNIAPQYLETGKDEHVQFGCMPSLNAYGMDGLKKDGREVPFRPAGGHIHFGCGPKTDKEVKAGVKALDAIIGVACVSLFEKYDDPRRRTMYGLAGEYRLPPHGIEYRTLSNAWLCHPLVMNMVFDLARKALAFGLQGYNKFWDATEKEVIQCINTCDAELARKILKRNEKIFKMLVKQTYYQGEEVVFNAFMKGVDSIVVNPNDIEANWNLNGVWTYHSGGAGKNFNNARVLLEKEEKVS